MKLLQNKTHFESDLSAFNLETQEPDSNDEAAANSIINVKNLTIKFATKFVNLNGFQMYLYNVIVPYLTQIIPSTTILNIELDELYHQIEWLEVNYFKYL